MELTLERPGDHLYIRSVSPEGIVVVDQVYAGSIIVSDRHIVADWGIATADELAESHLQPVFDLDPEVVLLGTGPRQTLLAPELLMCFYRRQVGVEVMTTPAACRTFNVLVSEGRKVVAALLPPG